MDIKIKRVCEITIKLEEYEAKDLKKILQRVTKQPIVSKSEFSLREKATARQIFGELEDKL